MHTSKTGISSFFRRVAPQLTIILADPRGSVLADYVNTGALGSPSDAWLVEGIGEDFLPSICDLSFTTRAFSISDDESFAAARQLLKAEGLLVGSSSGTCLAAALRFCRQQTSPRRVVTFACDTGNKYLSKLFNDFWMEDEGFIVRDPTGDLRDLIGRRHADQATVCVGPNDILTTAHNRLRNAGFSQLPVMDGDRLMGVLTEEDIIQYVYGEPGRMTAPVAEAMQTAVHRVDKTLPIDQLVSRLKAVPYTAVMDGHRFLGLITRSDVLNHLRKQLRDGTSPS